MPFQPISPQSVTSIFQNNLSEMIVSGELKIGDRLPPEAEMARQTGLSKSAVHQGIKELEKQGFVRIVPRKGLYVNDYRRYGTIETLKALVNYNHNNLDLDTVRSILEFRAGNEGTAVALMINRQQNKDLSQYRKWIEELKEMSDPEKMADLLYQFHLQIGIDSMNTVIPMVINGFSTISRVFFDLWIDLMDRTTIVTFLEDYLDAIEKGDLDQALQVYQTNADRFLEIYQTRTR